MSQAVELRSYLFLTILSLCVSVIEPYDMTTWLLEVTPVFIGIAVLLWSYKSFPLSILTYRLIFLHMLILIVGGHYSYARVPLGFWMQDWFDFTRNNYDRIGHFAQGFMPAIIAREILLRKTTLKTGALLSFLIVSVCLAISAGYELVEWAAAVGLGQGADEFLATQGDQWDTQADMLMALIGAVTALVGLGGFHDRSLARLSSNKLAKDGTSLSQ